MNIWTWLFPGNKKTANDKEVQETYTEEPRELDQADLDFFAHKLNERLSLKLEYVYKLMPSPQQAKTSSRCPARRYNRQ